MDELLEYVPLVGDIYRASRLGYKMGSWLGNDRANYNTSILMQMIDLINRAGDSSNVMDAYDYLTQFYESFNTFDSNNFKKYQAALVCFLFARATHITALCECVIDSDDLNELKKVRHRFNEAIHYCKEVWTIEKTLFTEKKDVIDKVRQISDDKKKEIKKSKKNWKKQYRRLYKKTHPWKWYLGMWIFV